MPLTNNTKAQNYSDAVRLYKNNSNFEGELCFTDYLNRSLALRKDLPYAWKEKADELNRIINGSCLHHDTSLFRATSDSYISPFVAKDEICYPAFMSTADKKEAVTRHFSGVDRGTKGALIIIKYSAMMPALNMEENPSFGGHEHEVLLPMNSRFSIESIKRIDERDKMIEVMGIYASNYSILNVYHINYLK
jgi:hypothetical protein